MMQKNAGNSCRSTSAKSVDKQHMWGALVWVWINRMMGQEKLRIAHQDDDHSGIDPHLFLFFHVCVPGCSRNGLGLCQNLLAQEKQI